MWHSLVVITILLLMLVPSSDLTLSLSQAVREAAYEAGAMALPFFRGGAATSAQLWFKGGNSPVTEADLALDAFLKERLSSLLPEAGWLSEETTDDSARLDRRFVWIVDPIDGTRAFASGHPDWSISIALVAEGRPLLGVVHAPTHDRLYEASLGGGATCNGQKLSLAHARHPDPLRVAGPQPLVERFSRHIGPVEHLPKVPSLALRLARVAEGTIDVGLVSADSHDWDIAAADLILREAGAVLTDFEGTPPVYNKPQPRHGEMVAVASRLHLRAIGAMRA